MLFCSAGGAISMSFGGNLQDPTVPRQHVQQACSDANSLAQLIQSAMNEFQTNNLEFDIEVLLPTFHITSVVDKFLGPQFAG